MMTTRWTQPSALLAALLLVLCSSPVPAIRLYKSRVDAIAMVGGGKKETRLYFHSCDQSSQRAACAFAMDSSVSQVPSQCAQTDALSTPPWWLGILETPSYVSVVTLLNVNHTAQAATDALKTVTVMANDDICFKYQSVNKFFRHSFPCDAMADQITIQSSVAYSVMALCDVEVLGVPLSFTNVRGEDALVNVSMCQQSTIQSNQECQNAFDRNLATAAVTWRQSVPWMKVLLSRPSLVYEIRLPLGTKFSIKDHNWRNERGLEIKISVNARLCQENLEMTEQNKGQTVMCKYFGNKVKLEGRKEDNNKEYVFRFDIPEIEIYGHETEFFEHPKYKYLGCYNDKIGNHDLSQLVSSTSMSHAKCYRMCKRLGLKFFALQYRRNCWCGSAFGKHGKADKSKCNQACSSEETEICGGDKSNSVFEIIAPTETVPDGEAKDEKEPEDEAEAKDEAEAEDEAKDETEGKAKA